MSVKETLQRNTIRVGVVKGIYSKDRYDILLWGLFLFEGVIRGNLLLRARGTVTWGSLV
jgi:hypothetical protein